MEKDISAGQEQWLNVPLLLEKNKVVLLSCSVVFYAAQFVSDNKRVISFLHYKTFLGFNYIALKLFLIV